MLERRQNRFSQPASSTSPDPVSPVKPVEPKAETPVRETPSRPVKEKGPSGPSDGGNNGAGGLKTVMTVLIVVVVALVAVLAYIWISKQKLVNELDLEKQELTEKMMELRSDYKDLSSDYANINAQLDSSREEVNQLIERIQKTEATNRAAIRRYEKELGTLRSIMKSYIVQIDSLNTANKKLKADVASARKDLSESRQRNEELSQAVDDLSGKVAAGSVLKARGIRLEGLRKNEKVTDRAGQVFSLRTSLSLIENDLAPKGPVTVYVLVRNADGVLLVNPEQPASMMQEEQEVVVSASREVDYNGAEVELSIYLKNMGKLTKGVYSVEIYTDNHKLGAAELMLR